MTDQLVAARGGPNLGGLAERLLRSALAGIDFGRLSLRLPSGRTLDIGHGETRVHASLHIHSWKLVWRLLLDWDVGFAESYMAGEWSSPNLPALLRLLSENRALDTEAHALGFLRGFSRFSHLLNCNTRRGSRRNIAAHYDLGNAFYSEWLDVSMTYSSGIYRRDGQTLDEAQDAKLSRIFDLLEMSGSENVLEIGCGWGALAERILDRHAGSLIGLTLSSEQFAFARHRLRRFEQTGRCDLRLQDYRDVRGSYDRIVSIEMLEAVGEQYWPIYFAKLRECLSQDGIAVLQVITIAENAFEGYCRYPDFIQRYIFPGGMLPTASIIESQIKQAGLELVSAEFFGSSYARTLVEWRQRFGARWPEIEPLGFDGRFQRMWDYYLAYCQAGFEAGIVNVGLYKMVRSGRFAAARHSPARSTTLANRA